MDNSILNKVAKIYELVTRGGTEGEKTAAKHMLDKIMKKYNLDESVLVDIQKKEYIFKYATSLDNYLLIRIMVVLTDDTFKMARKRTWHLGKGVKQIVCKMDYMDWVTVDSAYEYFRRHMKDQYKSVCAPLIARCRKQKTKNKKREELEVHFLNKYFIASKLYKENELKPVDVTDEKERSLRRMMDGVEGGSFNRQLVSSLLLNN